MPSSNGEGPRKIVEAVMAASRSPEEKFLVGPWEEACPLAAVIFKTAEHKRPEATFDSGELIVGLPRGSRRNNGFVEKRGRKSSAEQE